MRARAGLAVGLLLVLATLVPARSASSTEAVSCDGHLGTRTPVLLVHGFNTDANATWNKAAGDNNGGQSLAWLTGLPDVKLIKFRFGGGTIAQDRALSNHWVTDLGIGRLLARTIRCLAAASTAGGGRGKVVVLTHSMGGLALRCALDDECSGRDPVAADDIGAAVTIGTPNDGSFLRYGGYRISDAERVFGTLLSTACTAVDFALSGRSRSQCSLIQSLGTSEATKAFKPGSPEMTRLPKLPDAMTVLAIAGSINVTGRLTPFGRNTVLVSIGDLAVGVGSAHHFRDRITADEKATIDCGSIDLTALVAATTFLSIVQRTQAAALVGRALAQIDCWHGTETSDSRFLAAAARRIAKWQRDTPVAGAAVGATTTSEAPTSTEPPTPSTSIATTPNSAVAETSCDVFLRMSTDEQLATVRQMIDDYHLTGSVSGSVQVTWGSTRAMCSLYPPTTPIKRIYG